MRRALTPCRSHASSFCELLVEPIERARFRVVGRRLLLQIARSSEPGHDVERPAVEIDDARGQRREERAVVRHEQQRAGELAQVVLQPADRVDVEMVRRLVEEQEIAARETSALPSSVRRRHPPDSSPSGRSAGSDSRDTTVSTLLLEPPAVALLELVLELAEALEVGMRLRRRQPHRGVVIARDERAELAQPGGHFVEHGAIAAPGTS